MRGDVLALYNEVTAQESYIIGLDKYKGTN